MADYNQLNNAHLSKFDVIFSKNKEISNAILELVRTAYEDHHEEDKERRKKLVQCLQKRCNIIVDQLSDDTFKDNLKEKISSIVQNDKGFTSDLKKQIEEDLQETVEEVSEEQQKTNKTTSKVETKKIDLQSNGDLIDKVFSNKKFVKNIANFTQSLLNKNNSNRLKVLDKLFNKKLTFKEKRTSRRIQRKDTGTSKSGSISGIKSRSKDANTSTYINNDLVKKVTGGFGRLIKSFIDDKTQEKEGQKTLTRLFQEKLSEKISGTIKYLKHVKYKSLRGFVTIKKNLNPKGLFKLTGFLLFGTIKIFKTLVFGLFKGLFSLVRGIFKIGLNIVKVSFKVVTGVISSIFKVSKKITKGLLKLTGGFFGRIKSFFLSPQGAYITGFAIGWISAKIAKKYNEIKEKIEEEKGDLQKKFHAMRMEIMKKIGDNKYFGRLHEMLVAKSKFSQLRRHMINATRFLRNFSFTKAALGYGGGVIGGWVGRLVGTAIGVWLGVPALGAGIGTGLGYIAGDLLGKYFDSVPEKTDAQTQKERNLITSAITNKYKTKRQRKINSTKGLLQGKINDIDKEMEALNKKPEDKRTEEDKKKLEKLKAEKKKWSDSLEMLSGGKLITDEDETERHNNDEYVQKLTDLLRKEEEQLGKSDFQRNESIFATGIQKDGNYNIDDLFANATKGDFKMTNLGIQMNPPNGGNGMSSGEFRDYRMNRLQEKQALAILSTLKCNSVQAALGAYEKGQIPFSKIQSHANQLLTQQLLRSSVKIGDQIISVAQYLKGDIHQRIDGYGNMEAGSETMDFEDFKTNTFFDMQRQIDRNTTLTDPQEQMADVLTDRYIENYQKLTGATVSDEQRDLIHKSFENFLKQNRIMDSRQLDGAMKKSPDLFKDVSDTISNTISVGVDSIKIEEGGEEVPLADKLLMAFRDSMMQDSFMPEDLNMEYEIFSNEQMKKLGVQEQQIKKRNKTLEDAMDRNENERRKNMELVDQLRQLKGGVSLVPVEKEEEKIPDYLRANKDSGATQRDSANYYDQFGQFNQYNQYLQGR